jgi:hypothetical protein
MNIANSVLWRMVIILKVNKVHLFVSSVLFVFWYYSPNFLDTPHITVITNSWKEDYCRELFRKLQILPLYSQCIYSLLMFVVKNRNTLKWNCDIHNIGTRHHNDIHLPSAQSKLFQKGVFYSAITKYNQLPLTIKELSHDIKRFRGVMKRFIHSNSLYSLEEYFDFNW